MIRSPARPARASARDARVECWRAAGLSARVPPRAPETASLFPTASMATSPARVGNADGLDADLCASVRADHGRVRVDCVFDNVVRSTACAQRRFREELIPRAAVAGAGELVHATGRARLWLAPAVGFPHDQFGLARNREAEGGAPLRVASRGPTAGFLAERKKVVGSTRKIFRNPGRRCSVRLRKSHDARRFDTAASCRGESPPWAARGGRGFFSKSNPRWTARHDERRGWRRVARGRKRFAISNSNGAVVRTIPRPTIPKRRARPLEIRAATCGPAACATGCASGGRWRLSAAWPGAATHVNCCSRIASAISRGTAGAGLARFKRRFCHSLGHAAARGSQVNCVAEAAPAACRGHRRQRLFVVRVARPPSASFRRRRTQRTPGVTRCSSRRRHRAGAVATKGLFESGDERSPSRGRSPSRTSFARCSATRRARSGLGADARHFTWRDGISRRRRRRCAGASLSIARTKPRRGSPRAPARAAATRARSSACPSRA